LRNLPPERYEQLIDWMLAGRPYREIADDLREKFGVQTSLGSLSKFWAAEAGPVLIARRRLAVSTADEIAAEAQRAPGRFDAATIDALKRKAFEICLNPRADAGDVKAMVSLVLKSQAQDQRDREIALERERFEFSAARAALDHAGELRTILGDKSLGEPQRVLAVRKALFGEVPP
jgi:hypothetical protein